MKRFMLTEPYLVVEGHAKRHKSGFGMTEVCVTLQEKYKQHPVKE